MNDYVLNVYDEEFSYLVDEYLINEWENLKKELSRIEKEEKDSNKKKNVTKSIAKKYLKKYLEIEKKELSNTPISNKEDILSNGDYETYKDFYKRVLEIFGIDDYILDNEIKRIK